jgi:membrane-associated phospholipid phosphatase
VKLSALCLALLVCVGLLPTPAHAQALPTAEERLGADIASYVTLGVSVALDTRASCISAADRRRGCGLEAARLATTWAAAALLKRWLPRDRPCAPSCGIDRPNADFPSGHTAFAVSTIADHPRFLLAFSTGELRLLANKHDVVGVLGGAAIGAATSRWIR